MAKIRGQVPGRRAAVLFGSLKTAEGSGAGASVSRAVLGEQEE